jgi:hypothetical protein
MDALMLAGGFSSQTTDEPKSAEGPDGLFGPMEGQDRAEGDLDVHAAARSYLTWLDIHPAAKWGVGAAVALAASGALRGRRARSNA